MRFPKNFGHWERQISKPPYKRMETFFGGRAEQFVNTLLTDKQHKLTDDDLDRLAEMIAEARGRGAE